MLYIWAMTVFTIFIVSEKAQMGRSLCDIVLLQVRHQGSKLADLLEDTIDVLLEGVFGTASLRCTVS